MYDLVVLQGDIEHEKEMIGLNIAKQQCSSTI